MRTQSKTPEARHVVEFLKSDLTGDLQPRRLPTRTFKVHGRTRETATAGEDLPSGTVTKWTPCGTAPLLITNFHAMFVSDYAELALADKNGTFDSIVVGTAVIVGDKKSVWLHGGEDDPIWVVEGTLHIYSQGSLAVGTLDYAFTGVQR